LKNSVKDGSRLLRNPAQAVFARLEIGVLLRQWRSVDQEICAATNTLGAGRQSPSTHSYDLLRGPRTSVLKSVNASLCYARSGGVFGEGSHSMRVYRIYGFIRF
jgi:hypothetical protein